jgi:DNA-binding MarR family transcriptional regulator
MSNENLEKRKEDLEQVNRLFLDRLPAFIKEMFTFAAPKLTDLQTKLTFGQIHVLHSLGPNNLISMSELAQKFKVSMPSMTETVDKLVRLGLVERAADQKDRRLVLIKLSAEGTGIYKNIRAAREKTVKKLIEKLNNEDIETIKKMEGVFRKMTEALESERD